MSTEKMRKLMMLAETMDGVCPHCHGWGEYIDPEGFDAPVHCPHCDEDDEPIRKSRLVKDMAMDMDMDWTDLGLSDVEPEDLKGFPKINEAFTRKHFQMIADTLQKIEDPEIRRAQAEEYAAQFAADNPRFRRDLFMKAAGVEELDEVQTLPREIKDRDPIKPDWSDVEYETCPECGVEGGHENGCAVLGTLYNEDLNEEQSEFRLKDIVGADNFAELVSDMNTGGIDYSAAYFTPLYWHFLDEYPDEIPVGSRTGRPEDPEEYVLDNLERYHSEEIKQYMNTPDMDESNCGVCGETFKWEGSPDEEMCPRCTQEYLGENEDDGDVPSRTVEDYEVIHAIATKIDSAITTIQHGLQGDDLGAKSYAIQVRRALKELQALIESGAKPIDLHGKLRLAFTKAEELADLSYDYDDVLWDLQDADNLLYLHLNGRPVAIDEADADTLARRESWKGKLDVLFPGSRAAIDKFQGRKIAKNIEKEKEALKSKKGNGWRVEESCPCGKDGCECGPDCDCEPLEESMLFDLGIIGAFLGFVVAKGWPKVKWYLEKKQVKDILANFEENVTPEAVEKYKADFEAKLKSTSPNSRKALMHRIRIVESVLKKIADYAANADRIGDDNDYMPAQVRVLINHRLDDAMREVEKFVKKSNTGFDRREAKKKRAVKESANDNWGIGDYVVPAWETPGEDKEPAKVIAVVGDQVKVQDDFGNVHLMFPEDLRKASVEEGGVKNNIQGINDKYDDETLECKHCGDYFCTSKFGGECPEIQMDMFGDVDLDEIVESVLNERGMPKDYEMSDEELATEIEDETSEFERDKIDPEIEDEELGLRFD